MRTPPTLLLCLLFFGATAISQSTSLTPEQSKAATDPEVATLQAVTAFSPTIIESVHLSGTAHAIAGSTDEYGTFSFNLKRDGESSLRLDAGVLSRTETEGSFGDDSACSWAGSDGVQHNMAIHNCWLSLDWILPSFALQSFHASLDKRLSSEKGAQQETTQRLEFARTLSHATPRSQELVRKLSAVSLSLDPATSLPSSLSFNIHPEDDAGTNIPIIVRYSDYHQISGASIPFHIQKYLNNGLVLDLQVESAMIQ